MRKWVHFEFSEEIGNLLAGNVIAITAELNLVPRYDSDAEAMDGWVVEAVEGDDEHTGYGKTTVLAVLDWLKNRLTT